MMTPMHTDLMKHSAPYAPTAHEREALRARRQARRAALHAFIEKVLSYTPRYAVAPTRQRVNSAS